VAREALQDRLSEWSLVDSAGYIAPRPPNDQPDPGIFLDDIVRAQNDFTALRTTAFVQHSRAWPREDGSRWDATVGMRAPQWSLNGDLVGGPRGHVSWTTPTGDVWKLAGGMYYQPPFYRELRRFDGSLNTDLKAQLSLHAVLTSDRIVMWYDRPFKLVTEVYYKALRDLVPYELENVRQRYYAENLARGYAAGADVLDRHQASSDGEPVGETVVECGRQVLGGKLLKSVLGVDSFDRGIINLVVHETQSGVMVNKDGAALVPLLGEFPFQLGKKAHIG
jgi:hypothetical protein